MLNKKDKLLAAAQKFLERGSLDKALLEFQRAAQEDAKDTRTWLRIAEIHVKRGEATQATQVYLKTAELYVEQGFFQRAAAVYKNVLKLTPGHTDAHIKLAEVYRQLGLLSDSSQQFEAAAAALVRANRPKDAMAALGQIIEMNPDQVMIRVKIGEVAAQAGLNDEAVRELGRAAEQLEQQGRTDDYLRVAERLLQLAPDDVRLGKRAAIRYLERGNPKAALAKLQACFNVDNKDLETLQLLATAFSELGQTAKTVTVLKELAKVQEERRMMVERAATLQRIRTLDPTEAIPGGTGTNIPIPAPPPPEPEPPRFRAPVMMNEADAPAAVVPNDRRRREPTITFSELAVPPILAREPSQILKLGEAAMPSLDEEQIEAEIKRLLAETDTFVKYGLSERAADHVRKVFDLAPEHDPAATRLISILIDLGRTAEAVEELGILADRQSEIAPEQARQHLVRALELDPRAAGARHMLDRLDQRMGRAPEEVEELDMLDDELELDEVGELDLLPMVDEPVAAPVAAHGIDDDAAAEWQTGGATQIDPGLFGRSPAAAVPARAAATPPSARAVTPPSARAVTPRSAPSLDDLEIELDLPVAAGPSRAATPARAAPVPTPLDPAALGELEQVDFFLEQGLPDEALAVLDDLGSRVAGHPDVRTRRDRALALLDRAGPAASDELEDSATQARSAPIIDRRGDAGAVPRGPLTGDVSRAPVRDPSVTPRAVLATGAADPVTQRDLGIAYKEMGLYDAAIAEFSRLTDDTEHQVFALMMIGECYEAEGAFAEALLHYKKALNRPHIREDESTRLYFLLGRAFEALGDQGEALYFYEKVARRDADFADVAARVGKLRGSGVAPVDRTGDDRRRAGAGPRGSR